MLAYDERHNYDLDSAIPLESSTISRLNVPATSSAHRIPSHDCHCEVRSPKVPTATALGLGLSWK